MKAPEVTSRERRAIAVGAVALVVITVAGIAYLRSADQASGVRATDSPPASRNPINYSFVTPSLGWAVVNPFFPDTSFGQFRVFRTDDGAKHWRLQLSGPSTTPGFTPIAAHFFDTKHGYLTVDLAFRGAQLYRTSDGGKTWSRVGLPAVHSVVVTFSDFTHGWVAAQPETSGQLFILFASGDGGDSWQRLPDPPIDAYYLAVRNTSEALMGSMGQGPPHVYRSVDGGRSWQRHDLPPPLAETWDLGGHGTSVELLPQVGAVATTDIKTNANVSEAVLYVSLDNSDTWSYVSSPPGEVSFQDSYHWWAMSGTVLAKTSDAGQTWREVTDALPNWQFVPHVIDSRHAWAELTVQGGFGLGLTSDGGVHWARANVPDV